MTTENNGSARYSLSFTSGGLLLRESVIIATEYFESSDWAVCRANVLEQNLLQTNTRSTAERLIRETIQRLKLLSADELRFLTEASPSELRQLLWAAICRRYEIIADFAEEVLRERYLLMNRSLIFEDLERFLNGKALWHPEVEEIKDSTKAKLKQTLFRMMRDASLLTEDELIIPAILSDRIVDFLNHRSPSDIRFFPTNHEVRL